VSRSPDGPMESQQVTLNYLGVRCVGSVLCTVYFVD
jgi:hypothetical protein